MPPSRSTMTYHRPVMGPVPRKIQTKKDALISQCQWNYGKQFFGKILLEGIGCCVPKNSCHSLSRESFAQAHFWKHKAAAQRLWGCAGLSTRQILPAESGIREHLLQGHHQLSQQLQRNVPPWNIIPVAQGTPKTLEGPTLEDAVPTLQSAVLQVKQEMCSKSLPPQESEEKEKSTRL